MNRHKLFISFDSFAKAVWDFGGKCHVYMRTIQILQVGIIIRGYMKNERESYCLVRDWNLYRPRCGVSVLSFCRNATNNIHIFVMNIVDSYGYHTYVIGQTGVSVLFNEGSFYFWVFTLYKKLTVPILANIIIGHIDVAV